MRFIAALAALLLGAVPLMAQHTLPPGSLRDGTLSFEASATLGDFTGTTDTMTGRHSGGTLPEIRGWVEAPVGTLKTGNGMRDRDLNQSMETEQYPTMRFEVEQVVPDQPGSAADSVGAVLEGTLQLHGVTREIAVPAKIQFLPDSAVRIRSDFPVNVKDYGVGGLSKMLGMLRMNEHIIVHVDVTFAPDSAATSQ